VSTPGDFSIQATDGKARAATLVTAHGAIQTPVFMPVGTLGTVKGVDPEELKTIGTQILLGNTYHLHLKPGEDLVAELGGLHRFMAWDGPILTDSGGFQVFSLADTRTIDDDGVSFRSVYDGDLVRLRPEDAMAIQAALGSDIAMCLDEVPKPDAPLAELAAAVERTTRWAARCKATTPAPGQLRFGIVQGGVEPALRERSATDLLEIGFDGYAIGGLAVGEEREATFRITDSTAALLPVDRPRYFMGIGDPEGILRVIAAGVDMFDCVLPTRSGRTGQAFTHDGPINIRNARFADDPTPLDAASDCPASRDYSRAYLHHLIKAKEILGATLMSWHNVSFYQRLMVDLRAAIAAGRLEAFAAGFLARYRSGDAAES